MDLKVIRTAGVSLALCAGLGLGALAVASEARQPGDYPSGPVGEYDIERGYDRWFLDGTYSSSAAENPAVVVTIADGAVASVELAEGDASGDVADVLAAVVEANGTEGVEASGEEAQAALDAAEACLERARVHVSRGPAIDLKVIAEHQASDEAGVADGNYIGTSGDTTVAVTFKGGLMTAAITLTHEGDADKEELEEFCHEIVAENGTQKAEAEGEFSAVVEAINDAIAQASAGGAE